MPKEHIVNKKDGLNSLWKIAKHYNVSFQELKQKNSHLKDRDPAYWINIGDKILLPEKQPANKKVGGCVGKCLQNDYEEAGEKQGGGEKSELNKSLKGWFDPETDNPVEIKCGNKILLKAESKNINNGERVEFVLKRIDNKTTVETLSTSLTSSNASAEWISKKSNDDWGKPEIYFDVSSDGITEKSKNDLTFFEYTDVASESQTFVRSSGIYGWTGKYDIKLTDRKIIVTLNIKLINYNGTKPAAGAALPALDNAGVVSAADKASMKADIESKLSNKWIVHRDKCERGDTCDCPNGRKCCKIQVDIIVNFVENGEHHTVNLFQGRGQANANNWTRIKTRNNSYAHETGHLLGWFDEYTGGATGVAPRWTTPRAGAVMNTGLTVPVEYYWDLRDWFSGKKADESWELISP